MKTITKINLQDLSFHISRQHHAMAGATIAASAALACSLGLACVRINIESQSAPANRALAQDTAARLDAIRLALLHLADEDGAAIAVFAALRDAGHELHGQAQLCQLPVDMASLGIEAGILLQQARPLLNSHQDDLEMSIRLLDGAVQAAILLLDSNLRIWPDSKLLEQFEPILAQLLAAISSFHPVQRVRLSA